MKRFLSLLLIALMLLNFAACGKKQSGELTEETKAEETTPDPEEIEEEEEDVKLSLTQQIVQNCVDAMFEPDMQAIFDLANPKLMEYSRSKKHMTDEQYAAVIDTCNAKMQNSIDKLDAMYDDWDIEIEFLEQTPLADTRLYNLRNLYAAAEINISGGSLLKVRIYAVLDGEKIPLQDTTFSCVQILGRWYLDTAFTELIPQPEELDGTN